jgi:hypothetical protein
MLARAGSPASAAISANIALVSMALLPCTGGPHRTLLSALDASPTTVPSACGHEQFGRMRAIALLSFGLLAYPQ